MLQPTGLSSSRRASNAPVRISNGFSMISIVASGLDGIGAVLFSNLALKTGISVGCLL